MKVLCELQGGLNGTERIEVSMQAASADGLAVATGDWVRRRADGGGDQVNGRIRPSGVPWISESQELFSRQGRTEEGLIRYVFVRSREQLCCSQYVKKLKRHCLNAADEGKQLCPTHLEESTSG
jgi:hypothetical protein